MLPIPRCEDREASMRAFLKRWLLLACLLLLGSCAPNNHRAPPEELTALFTEDQAERRQIVALINQFGFDSPSVKARFRDLEKSDNVRIERLRSWVRKHGWPLLSKDGQSAVSSAFTILDHADVSVQKELVQLIDEAADQGEVPAAEVALLHDKIDANEGRCQRFGSQVIANKDGNGEFYPICDMSKVEDLRRKAGLEPLDEYAKAFSIDVTSLRQRAAAPQGD